MSSAIGQDTIHYTLNDNFVFTCIHLSNDTKTLISQIDALKTHCLSFPNRTIVIMGDFNAIPKQPTNSKNSIDFYSKDDNSLQSSIQFDRIVHVSDITTPTTCKERLITVQLIKFLKKASAAIDGIIIIEPIVDSIFNPIDNILKCITSIKSCVKIFKEEITGECIAPIEWMSDHYIVQSNVKYGSDELYNELKFGTLNAFGESIGNKQYNIFEMLTESVINKMNSNPEIKNTFLKILESQPDINGVSFERLYMDKVFSKELRKFNIFNIHVPPKCLTGIKDCELLNELAEMYENEHQIMISSATDEQLEYANAILNLWREFYTDPLLSDLFVEWFNEIATSQKASIEDVVMAHLIDHTFDVFGLQEINASMLQKFHELTEEFDKIGYVFIGPPTITTKTCGVMFISKLLV